MWLTLKIAAGVVLGLFLFSLLSDEEGVGCGCLLVVLLGLGAFIWWALG